MHYVFFPAAYLSPSNYQCCRWNRLFILLWVFYSCYTAFVSNLMSLASYPSLCVTANIYCASYRLIYHEYYTTTAVGLSIVSSCIHRALSKCGQISRFVFSADFRLYNILPVGGWIYNLVLKIYNIIRTYDNRCGKSEYRNITVRNIRENIESTYHTFRTLRIIYSLGSMVLCVVLVEFSYTCHRYTFVSYLLRVVIRDARYSNLSTTFFRAAAVTYNQ